MGGDRASVASFARKSRAPPRAQGGSVKKAWILAAAISISCGGAVNSTSDSDNLDTTSGQGAHEPPMLGIHYAKGQGGNAGGSPDMTSHGGPILTSSVTAAIFWGASWASSSFAGDKIRGIDSWYDGFGDSNYAKASTEYS